jgi:hypothetical protein
MSRTPISRPVGECRGRPGTERARRRSSRYQLSKPVHDVHWRLRPSQGSVHELISSTILSVVREMVSLLTLAVGLGEVRGHLFHGQPRAVSDSTTGRFRPAAAACAQPPAPRSHPSPRRLDARPLQKATPPRWGSPELNTMRRAARECTPRQRAQPAVIVRRLNLHAVRCETVTGPR